MFLETSTHRSVKEMYRKPIIHQIQSKATQIKAKIIAIKIYDSCHIAIDYLEQEKQQINLH